MMTREDIVKITEACADKEYNIKVRDIAYLILRKHIAEKDVAYMSLFGVEKNDGEIEDYDKSEKIEFLRTIIDGYIPTANARKDIPKVEDITFEDNKDALVALLDEIKKAVFLGEIEKKDAIKLETEIRVKLNDKFNVADETKQQYIIVEPKFNHICEWTHKECWLQTKEFAMKHWNLCEKEELKNDDK